MMSELISLRSLELSLWRSETRYNRSYMEATLAPEAFEFGRSGRRYTRADLLPKANDRQDIDASLHDLTVHGLSSEVALVTYISEVHHAGGTEWANRSSIWDRLSGHWQLRFHQGTPCDGPK
jgi:hypothetical protein